MKIASALPQISKECSSLKEVDLSPLSNVQKVGMYYLNVQEVGLGFLERCSSLIRIILPLRPLLSASVVR